MLTTAEDEVELTPMFCRFVSALIAVFSAVAIELAVSPDIVVYETVS
jgi:hypothetical protein